MGGSGGKVLDHFIGDRDRLFLRHPGVVVSIEQPGSRFVDLLGMAVSVLGAAVYVLIAVVHFGALMFELGCLALPLRLLPLMITPGTHQASVRRAWPRLGLVAPVRSGGARAV